MQFITMLKYWYIGVILGLSVIIGIQYSTNASLKVDLAQQQAIIDVMSPVIESNNKTIDDLSAKTETLNDNIKGANKTNEFLKKQLGIKIGEVMNNKLPSDCSGALNVTIKQLAKETDSWNSGN